MINTESKSQALTHSRKFLAPLIPIAILGLLSAYAVRSGVVDEVRDSFGSDSGTSQTTPKIVGEKDSHTLIIDPPGEGDYKAEEVSDTLISLTLESNEFEYGALNRAIGILDKNCVVVEVYNEWRRPINGIEEEALVRVGTPNCLTLVYEASQATPPAS